VQLDPVKDTEDGLLCQSKSILGLWDLRRNFNQDNFLIKLIPSEEAVKHNIQNTPIASSIEITYRFSTKLDLRERYLRADGRGIRFGKMIEEMDALAGDCCYKYMVKDWEDVAIQSVHGGKSGAATLPFYLVTVSVDRIDFANKINGTRDLKMSAYMMSASGSTMIVKIDCFQKNEDDTKWENIGDALVLFVARNAETLKSYKVPEMRLTRHCDVMTAKSAMEIG
jgi:hypothetical protein